MAAPRIATIIRPSESLGDTLTSSFGSLDAPFLSSTESLNLSNITSPISPRSPVRAITPLPTITTGRMIDPTIAPTIVPQPTIVPLQAIVLQQAIAPLQAIVPTIVPTAAPKIRKKRIVSPKQTQVLVSGPLLTITTFTDKNHFLRGTINPDEPKKYMKTLNQLTNKKISFRDSKQLGKGWAIPIANYQTVAAFVRQVNAGQLPIATPQVAIPAPAIAPSPIPSPRGNFIGNVAFADGNLLLGGAGELYDVIKNYTSQAQFVQALQTVQAPATQGGHLFTKEGVLILSNFGGRKDTNVYVERDAAGLDAQITLV